MTNSFYVGKREFIQHTSKYLSLAEKTGQEIIITHHRQPELVLTLIRPLTIQSLSGSVSVQVEGDINEPVLPEFDQWSF